MKKQILFIGLFFYSLVMLGQAPAIEWEQSFGGTKVDNVYCIQQTTDGGYVVGGYAGSKTGDVTGAHGLKDFWIVKLDDMGALQWQKAFGGSADDAAYSIQQTSDGGYIAAGYSKSINGDLTLNHGLFDYWVVKMDALGTIEWQKTYGGTNSEVAYGIQQTTDGGYIVVGNTKSVDGDITSNHGLRDYWVLKLDVAGTIEWQKTYGGLKDDFANAIQQTIDGGYIIGGCSKSNDGDVSANHGLFDYWVVKLDNAGAMKWQKTFGGTKDEYAYSIQQTTDTGYVVAGYAKSTNGDVIGNHGLSDYWVVKMDTVGTIQWQKTLGGTGTDVAFSIKQTIDGGYIVAGQSKSIDGDVTSNHGLKECWLVKLDDTSAVQWQLSLGGAGNDVGQSIQQTADGGYVVAVSSASVDGDVTGNHGLEDYWIVKLNSRTVPVLENQPKQLIGIYPNPSKGLFRFNGLSQDVVVNTERIIEVYDITGRSIYKISSKENACTIDLRDKNKGIYFYKIIESGKSVQQGKLLIQ